MAKNTTNLKLKRALRGGDMADVDTSTARPGAWKAMLLPAPNESEVNKHRHVPTAIDDAIVAGVADGKTGAELETQFELREGYVRSVLIRRFGSLEGMKKALQAQCLENAIALNEYAMSKLDQIAPGQALVGAKIMIDGALALERNAVDRPSTVDFASFAALGSTLDRLEKRVEAKVIR